MFKKKEHNIKGIIVGGVGESSDWMPVYMSDFYPGTLNIQMSEKKSIHYWDQVINTHYGRPAKYKKCRINGIDAYLVKAPMYNEKKNPFLIEVAHKKKLRKFLKLEDGDEVIITFID